MNALPRTRPGARVKRLPSLWASLALACSLGACDGGAVPSESASYSDGWITIGDQRIALEIARTPEQQELGLGGRASLAWGQGMLFQYDKPIFPRFWMKDMRFDIDIIWIREGRVIEISNQVPHVPGENGPTASPRSLADTVLEVPSGFAQANRWHRGLPVKLEILTD